MADYNVEEEFLEADSTQRYILLMAHFGRAIYYSQLIEQQCVNMLAINEYATSEIENEREYQALWDKHDFSKKTLGVMAMEIQKAFAVTDDVIGEIKEVVNYRNFLTHNYFRFNDVLMHSDSGKSRMIKDFYNFTLRAKKLDRKLETYLAGHNKKLGFSKEKLHTMLDQVKRQWTDKTIDDSFNTFQKNN
jgi:hypothetical protein